MTITQTAGTATNVHDGVEFAHVDPRTLIIDTNVRKALNLDEAFLDSIRTYGVCQPVQAIRDADGNLVVRAGQRRTLAAIETDQATIPVVVIPDGPDEAWRILTQMDENDRRSALTGADRADAFKQLSLFGITAEQIAKRSHSKRTDVDAALTVTSSPVAAAVLAKYDLTLDQAAVLAGFDDAPEVLKALTVTAVEEPERFAHAAQEARDERDAKRVVDAATADLIAAGFTILENHIWQDNTATDLNYLRDSEGKQITEEAHATCPGRAAHVTHSWHGLSVTYGCVDPNTNGHTARSSMGTPVAVSGPMNDEQKAERRAVIDGNKAWRSSEKVRRAWIREFAARKVAPKDAPAFISWAVTNCADDLVAAASSGHPLAGTLLGLVDEKSTGRGGRAAINGAIDGSSQARAQLIGLVVILAAIEARTGVHTWRHPQSDVIRYLTTLASWGYNLSDVERKTSTPDQPRTRPAAPVLGVEHNHGENTYGSRLPAQPAVDDEDDDVCEGDDEYDGAEFAGEEAQAASDAQE